MIRGKALIIALLTLIIGFVAGFVLRPALTPPGQAKIAATPSSVEVAPSSARDKQYFAEKPDEARRIVAGCRSGSVRGKECANAEQALTEAEGRNRFKKFMGN